VIKAKLGHRLDAWLLKLFPFVVRWPLHPNLFTVIGTAVSLGAAVGFSLGHFRAGAVLLLAGGFFDLVDGVVARQRGSTSAFGAFLDSTLDRLVDMAVLLGLMMFYSGLGQAETVLLAGVALIASVMTSYAKARVEEFVPSMSGGLLERGERIVLLALGGLTGWMVPVLWILAVFGSFTVAQRFWIAHRTLAATDRAAARSAGEPS
jgi:CDP-diacylglycerol---glycerol-3-phosphate 3-phosphatidyltransferase